jgi:regulator of protease activity HflC (stomatin/prohibitin superfamily)
MAELLGVLVLVAVVLLVVIKMLPVKHVIVYEYQKGLKYSKGRCSGTLDPGSYWIISTFSSIVTVDVRPEFITIQGQDVLSADGVTLKVSLAAEFQVADPNTAVNKNANFRTSLYLSLQMALRAIVGAEKIDATLDGRTGISAKLMELTTKKASELGLKLISVDIKDIMFPGEMKKVFAQVVKAQKEGQAALERARGETAALRSLANAARTMDDNPNLLQLRALQALADSSGNTLVMGLQSNAIPLPKKSDRSEGPPRERNAQEDE